MRSPFDEAINRKESGDTLVQIFESAHPYPDNENRTFKIAVGEGYGMEIVFSNESATELNYDYIKFLKAKGAEAFHGAIEKYSGGRGGSEKIFPGVNGVPALQINASECWGKFFSDGSNNDWGYKFAVISIPLVEKKKSLLDLEQNLKLQRKNRASCLSLAKSLFYFTLHPDTVNSKAMIFDDIKLDAPHTYLNTCRFPGAESLTLVFDTHRRPPPANAENKFDIIVNGQRVSGDEPIISDNVSFEYFTNGKGATPGVKVTVIANYPDLVSIGEDETEHRKACFEDMLLENGFNSLEAFGTTSNDDVGTLFDILLDFVDSEDEELCKWSSLILCNIVRSASKEVFVDKYKLGWIKRLFRVKSPSVQLFAIQSLMGADSLSRDSLTKDDSDSVSEENLAMIEATELEDLFVELLSSDENQLISLARTILTKLLGIGHLDMSVDKLLLQCLNTESANIKTEIVQRAMIEIRKRIGVAHVADSLVLESNAVLVVLRVLEKCISSLQPGDEIQDNVLHLVLDAAETLLAMVSSECALLQFFKIDGLGLNIVAKLVQIGNNTKTVDVATKERIGFIGIAILGSIVELQRFGPDSLGLHHANDNLRQLDYKAVVGGSLCVNGSTLPQYFQIGAEEEAVDTKKAVVIKSKKHNDEQFSLSFWIYVTSMGAHDGIPVFYKGKPNMSLSHRDSTTTSLLGIKADALLITKKVYFEVTYKTQVQGGIYVGWTSPAAFDHEGIDCTTDQKTFTLFLSQDMVALCWGGFTERIDMMKTITPGCVVGVCLDSGTTISFYLNNVLIGTQFTNTQHGPHAGSSASDDSKIQRDAKGPDWSQGFSPFVALSPGAVAEINLGVDPAHEVLYCPADYIPVHKALAKISVFPPPLMSLAQTRNLKTGSRWEAIRLGAEGVLADIEDPQAMSLTLLQNMRLCFKISYQSTAEQDQGSLAYHQLSKVTTCALTMNSWNHCLLRVDEDSVDFVLNGVLDSEHVFEDVTVFFNNYPFGIGLGASSFDVEGTAWIGDFRSYDQAVVAETVLADGLVPNNLTFVRKLASFFLDKAGEEVLATLRNSATASTVDAKGRSLRDLSREIMIRVLTEIEDRVTSDVIVSRFGVEALGTSLLQQLTLLKQSEISQANKANKRHVTNLLARFTALHCGRELFIRGNKFLLLLTMMLADGDGGEADVDAHFGLERAICNLSINSATDLVLFKSLASSDNILYFDIAQTAGSSPQPFTQSERDSKIWRKLSPLACPMSNNPKLFVKICNLIGHRLTELKMGDDGKSDFGGQFNVAPEHFNRLVNWMLMTVRLLTTTVGKNHTIHIDPSSHPYGNNEDIRGVVNQPDALSLSCKWDERCSTERNYDYFSLFVDEACAIPLNVGPNGNGRFTGPNSDGWHLQDLELSVNKFYWLWHTDGKICQASLHLCLYLLFVSICTCRVWN